MSNNVQEKQIEDQVVNDCSTVTTAVEAVPNLNPIHDEVRKRIKQHAIKLGLSHITIDVAPGSNLGDNFMGFIGKLTINGQDTNGLPKTFNWIIKIAPNTELHRTLFNATLMYTKEAYTYEEIFPVFKQFQAEKRILKPFNEHPTLIFTHMEFMMESIIMEDMKHIGYVMANRKETLDLSHVKLVMKTYGKLHALSYALKDQQPELFEKVIPNSQDAFKDISDEDAHKSLRPLMISALETLDPVKHTKVIAKFKKFIEQYIRTVKDATSSTNRYSVIGHGDSWVNNILWKYTDLNNPTIPTNICLLDWQLCRYGSPALDLSYFLFTCTDKNLRDKHYDNMIRLYYYTLCSQVAELGSDPAKLLPYEALQQELKDFSIAGVYMSICVLYVITRDTDEMAEWRTDDTNPQELGQKWATKSANADKYNQRISGVIVDAYERGYLDCIT